MLRELMDYRRYEPPASIPESKLPSETLAREGNQPVENSGPISRRTRRRIESSVGASWINTWRHMRSYRDCWVRSLTYVIDFMGCMTTWYDSAPLCRAQTQVR